MSTTQQKYSLENQRALIAAYAARHGYKISATYEDAGRSGLSINQRSGLQALLRDVASSPEFSVILVVDVSRWGRYQDPDEAAHYEFLCRDAGVVVKYCAETFDDDGSTGSALMKSLKRAMASEYSRQLSDRVKAGRQRGLALGSCQGGRAPYGFARQAYRTDGVPGRLLGAGERAAHRDEHVRLVWGSTVEVETVRRIFQRFVSGRGSVSQIASELNADGVPYSQPGPWDYGRVKRVLQNELTTGVLAYNKTSHALSGPRVRLKSAQWGRLRLFEAMVPNATFKAAQLGLEASHGVRHTSASMVEALRSLLRQNGFLSRRLGDAGPPSANLV